MVLREADIIAHTNTKGERFAARSGVLHKNGTKGGYFRVDGKVVYRIYESSKEIGEALAGARRATAARRRTGSMPLSAKSAQNVFNRYYGAASKVGRGPRKGSPRWASPKKRRAARSYDVRHTLNNASKVITDDRFRHNPGKYDYPGVDTGVERRGPKTKAERNAAAKRRRAASPKKKRKSPKKTSPKKTSPKQAASPKKKRKSPKKTSPKQTGGLRLVAPKQTGGLRLVAPKQTGGYWW